MIKSTSVTLRGLIDRPKRFLSVFILLTALMASAVVPSVYAMSDAKEMDIGRKMHEEIIKQTPAYPDEAVQSYVDQIGQHLASLSERPDLEWHFTVIDSEQINAFAIPGGYIYIYSGLLTYLDTEAELAGVLGHEIGHITGRHSSRQKFAAGWSKALSTIAAVAVGVHTGSNAAMGSVQDVGNIAGAALVTGYGRDMELEADSAGARYLLAGGYDPQSMIDVIGVLKDQERFSKRKAKESGKRVQGYHGVFSSHPRNDERLRNVIGEVGEVEAGAKMRGADGNFQRYMQDFKFLNMKINSKVDGARYYNRPMDFTVAFPSGWNVKTRGATIQARGQADKGLMQLRVRKRRDESKPEAYLKKMLKLDNSIVGEPIEVNGLLGYSATIPVNAAKKNTSIRRVAVLYHGKRAFIFSAQANNKVLNSFYDSLFKASIWSFRPLNDFEKSIVLARQLKYVQAVDGMTFATLASVSPIKKYAEQELRLLNGYYPNGEPKPGEWIRIVD